MKIIKSVGENVLDVVELKAMVLWIQVKFDYLKKEYYNIVNEGDFKQMDFRWMTKVRDKSQNHY